ncbi:MAG: metallophosphoesterase [Chlamydiia bacterium]
MNIFAIADLHLALGVPQKRMGDKWQVWHEHEQKLYDNFHRLVSPNDLVLLPGDISWAMNLEEAKPDFEFLSQLPGKKVLLKGNHDYWWPSDKKLTEFLDPSITFIHKNALEISGVSIGGSRLWENDEISSASIMDFVPGSKHEKKLLTELDKKKFLQEYDQLEHSLLQMPSGKLRIAMTHYPPIEPTLASSRFSPLFEKYHIQHVLFGHIHNAKKLPLYGEKNGVHYHMVAADYLNFCPKQIATLP